MNCRCDYCTRPIYKGNGPWDEISYPMLIRIRIGDSSMNAVLENERNEIRFCDAQVVKGFPKATSHAHIVLGQRETRRQGVDELERWTIHVEGIGSVPLSFFTREKFVSDPSARPIASFEEWCTDVGNVESKQSLRENPIARDAKMLRSSTFFQAASSAQRASKRARNDADDDADDDCTPTCTWNIHSPASEWTTRNLQEFLLAYSSQAPILLGIDAIIPLLVDGVGNPMMRIRLQHTKTNQPVSVLLSCALLYTVPQYKLAVQHARCRFGF